MKFLNQLLFTALAPGQIISNFLDRNNIQPGPKINVLGLLQMDGGWINALLKNDMYTSPRELRAHTNVKIPSIDRIQFHFNSALQSYCRVTSILYMNCFLGKYRGSKILRSFDHLFHGSMVVIVTEEVRLDYSTLFSAKPKICSQLWDEDPKCQWDDRPYLNPVGHINGFNEPAAPTC